MYKLVFDSKKPWILSANGTIFTTEKLGIIPGLLARWFADRMKMQTKMKEIDKIKTGIEIPEELLESVKKLLS